VGIQLIVEIIPATGLKGAWLSDDGALKAIIGSKILLFFILSIFQFLSFAENTCESDSMIIV
jgi:hypothetical protein